MMSDTASARIRDLQAQMVRDSDYATTRAETVRLRIYWGELERILREDVAESQQP